MTAVAAPLAAVARELEGVLASVEALRAEAVVALEAVERPARGDLAALREPVAALLERHRGFAAGAGVVLAPGVLADAARWLEWWWADRGAGIERLEVDLDEDSAEFYDYTTTEWYRGPEQTGRPAVAGPYVDYICTHEYTFTLAVPLLPGGRFAGVAGADVLAAEVERAVLPELARRERLTVLASDNGRVIASNAAALAPGVVLARQEVAARLEPLAGARSSILPWTLLELGTGMTRT
ncbi:MAG TPA: cache domain-containing protein [Gaiellaceae bacterium]